MKQPSLIEAWDNYKKLYRVGLRPTRALNDQAKIDVACRFEDLRQFVATDLTIGDFIPCKDGKPLDIPKDLGHTEWIEYQQALDRVVYKGWFMRGETLENESNTHTIILGAYTFILVGDNWVVTELKTRADMAGFELTETGSKIYK
jgi:hypothetical protein